MKIESYIFGMAKSSLNLIGAKRQKLELDYLRLVYVCQHYQRLGHQATGFLAVTSDAIVVQALKWQKCYQVPDGVIKVLKMDLTEEEKARLVHNQSLNRLGMSGTLDRASVAAHANATYGRNLIEKKLLSFVQEKYPSVELCGDFKDSEMEISWDLFGKF